MSKTVAAIVPAAGLSRRYGGSTRKAYVQLAGKPVLVHTLQALESAPSIGSVQVLVKREDIPQTEALIKRYQLKKVLPPAVGGASRSASVANGVKLLASGVKWVVIHDGARPCVSPQLIEKTLRAAKRHGAAVCGIPAASTVKQVTPKGLVCATLDRKTLWTVQTPQVFRRDWLEQALHKAGRRLSVFWDDAHVLESAGFSVHMVKGEEGNIKVTRPADTAIASALLKGVKT